jgi:hypothetical protein
MALVAELPKIGAGFVASCVYVFLDISFGCSGQLAGYLVGYLVGWLAIWFVSLVGRLFGRLVSYLVRFFDLL